MANTTFDGPVRSKNGFINLGPAAVKAELLATDLTVADHAGRLVTMDPTEHLLQSQYLQSFQLLILLLQDQEVIRSCKYNWYNF